MHDITYNERRDEFYVPNPFAQAILTFRGGASGQEPPIRVLQGPKTTLTGSNVLGVDAVNDEIFVPQGKGILVFPLTANGDVAPIRVIGGGNKWGWRATGGGLAVDPIHNVLVATGILMADKKQRTPYRDSSDSLLIFDRLANGETKPLRVISGPQTGMHFVRQLVIQPKGGWIVITQQTDGDVPEPEGTYVGVYSINDSGDIPPRWKIEGKPSNGMKKPHGIDLDPKHKEVIVADMTMNAVLTFYFPEIF
jgi:hypothetical protein